MIEPRIDWARAISPPMPSPWTARAASSSGTFCTAPAAREPSRKTTIATWTRTFLLKRSESLLQIGLVTVIASSEAVTTQVYCVWVPSRSPMIVGRAVETIVVLTIATKSADIRPMRTSTISLWDISACCGRVPTMVVSDMGVLAGLTGGFVQVDGEVLDHGRGTADLVEVPV